MPQSFQRTARNLSVLNEPGLNRLFQIVAAANLNASADFGTPKLWQLDCGIRSASL